MFCLGFRRKFPWSWYQSVDQCFIMRCSVACSLLLLPSSHPILSLSQFLFSYSFSPLPLFSVLFFPLSPYSQFSFSSSSILSLFYISFFFCPSYALASPSLFLPLPFLHFLLFSLPSPLFFFLSSTAPLSLLSLLMTHSSSLLLPFPHILPFLQFSHPPSSPFPF